MAEDYWQQRVRMWTEKFDIQTRPGVKDTSLKLVENVVGPLPLPLRGLLSATNGIEAEIFRVLPIFDEVNPKSTWDSLERANSPNTSRFLDGDEELLAQFIVFADIGGGRCAAFGRDDGAIWFEGVDDLCQTDLELWEFVESSLVELG